MVSTTALPVCLLLLLSAISVLCLLTSPAQGLTVRRHHPFRFFNTHEQRERTFRALAGRTADQMQQGCDSNPSITEAWFTQKFDQFNASDDRTYGQRYFVNWQYYNSTVSGSQPVVFLMLGGEGEMTKQWVCWENYTYMQLAKEAGAIIVQLEHRFFGKNTQMTDLSVPNLAYLTTEQALADAAAFIAGWPAQANLTGGNVRWVAFGGSYPGSLAAWLRVKYPNSTIGNVASSAPLWPKVNFWEYADVMERTILTTSPDCYTNVSKAFADLKTAALSDAGRAQLTTLFRISPALGPVPDDITTLYGYAFSAFQGIIQYTYDGRRQANFEGLDIGNACNIMTNATVGTPLARLAAVFFLDAKYDYGMSDTDTIDVNYADNVQPFLNVDINSDGAAMRGWMWLSCNEFGWLQTTDKGNNIFGDIISLGSYYKLCADLFGSNFNSGYTEVQVAGAVQTFGVSSTYNATNVVLPNGAFDPWSALGSNMTINEQHQVAVLTAGAAHCSDMYPAYVGEPAALNATRTVVMNEVRYYLQSTQGNGVVGAQAVGVVGMVLMLMVALLLQ